MALRRGSWCQLRWREGIRKIPSARARTHLRDEGPRASKPMQDDSEAHPRGEDGARRSGERDGILPTLNDARGAKHSNQLHTDRDR